jgi:hypothetical protein
MKIRTELFVIVLAAMALLSLSAGAQTDSVTVIRGIVRDRNGAPLRDVNVFLSETLEGALTSDSGSFAITTHERGDVTLVARRIGFQPTQLNLALPLAQPVAITLIAATGTLAAVTVRAGAYTAGDQRGATLTSLQVATTPGATADVARAMQTLPGVQNVDEGTGLFVRGGDVSETKVVLNDAVMISPYNYEAPVGSYTVTVNPFLLDGIFFSSGGFGVRYGNMLSAVADLRTQGRPSGTVVNLAAGLASVSGSGAIRLPHGFGLRGTAGRSNTNLLFRVNGSTRNYTPPPNGSDYSASGTWNYRPSGELKFFGITRRTELGIAADALSANRDYALDTRDDMYILNWHEALGRFAPTVSLSTASVHRAEEFSVFELGNRERSNQLFSQIAWSATPGLIVRAGADAESRQARFTGVFTPAPVAAVGQDPIDKFKSSLTSTRQGAFIESDWRPIDRLRATAGIRTDHSNVTGVQSVDPRFSAAFRLDSSATLTMAVGIYHQVPDPLYFDESLGEKGLGPMRARQIVVGAQIGETRRIARVEVYTKQYDGLAQLSRDKRVVGGGTGESNGLDFFLKGDAPLGINGRLSYSFVNARRTDANTGIVARAPFDVTHSATLIGERAWGNWRLAGAYRYATGKPYTPVQSAVFDSQQQRWIPTYAAPYSDRQPDNQRFDLSGSVFRQIRPAVMGVAFIAVQNVFNRVNIYQYQYSADFSERTALRSQFSRSVYIGGSLTYIRIRK